MQDTLEYEGIALNAIRARTKPQSDLRIAHFVRLENSRLVSWGKPAQTRVLLVNRAHFELNREGLRKVIVHRA